MNGTTVYGPDMGPGPVIVSGAAVSLAFLATVIALVLALVALRIVLAVSDRRQRRRAALADLPRYSRDEVEAHLDCLATNDPKIVAALARLDEVVRGQRKGDDS